MDNDKIKKKKKKTPTIIHHNNNHPPHHSNNCGYLKLDSSVVVNYKTMHKVDVISKIIDG